MTAQPSIGIHEDLTLEQRIVGSSDRSVGLVSTAVALIVALWPLTRGHAPRAWALAIGVVLLLVAVARPTLAPFSRAWTRFGLLLHRLVSPVVLGLIYYATVTPLGVMMRLVGKTPLPLRFDPRATSYWIERRPPGPAPSFGQAEVEERLLRAAHAS
jgi:hypothetical protein